MLMNEKSPNIENEPIENSEDYAVTYMIRSLGGVGKSLSEMSDFVTWKNELENEGL